MNVASRVLKFSFLNFLFQMRYLISCFSSFFLQNDVYTLKRFITQATEYDPKFHFIECIIKAHMHPPHLSIPWGKTIWSCSLVWVIFIYEVLREIQVVVWKTWYISFCQTRKKKNGTHENDENDIKCMICCGKRQYSAKQNYLQTSYPCHANFKAFERILNEKGLCRED